MKLKNVNWDKKLIVFFGNEVDKYIDQIRMLGQDAFVEVYPEQDCCHPWEHVESIEHTTYLLSRDNDRKFVVVTNSSYIIDHLQNLMKGARLDADPKFAYCGKKDVFIKKKDVGAYVCTKGKIKNAIPKEGEVIKWGNLSEVAEWICNVYFDMEK